MDSLTAFWSVKLGLFLFVGWLLFAEEQTLTQVQVRTRTGRKKEDAVGQPGTTVKGMKAILKMKGP